MQEADKSILEDLLNEYIKEITNNRMPELSVAIPEPVQNSKIEKKVAELQKALNAYKTAQQKLKRAKSDRENIFWWEFWRNNERKKRDKQISNAEKEIESLEKWFSKKRIICRSTTYTSPLSVIIPMMVNSEISDLKEKAKGREVRSVLKIHKTSFIKYRLIECLRKMQSIHRISAREFLEQIINKSDLTSFEKTDLQKEIDKYCPTSRISGCGQSDSDEDRYLGEPPKSKPHSHDR